MNDEFITDEQIEELVSQGWIWLHCEDCEQTFLSPPSNPLVQALKSAGLVNVTEGVLIDKEHCSKCNPFKKIDLSVVVMPHRNSAN